MTFHCFCTVEFSLYMKDQDRLFWLGLSSTVRRLEQQQQHQQKGRKPLISKI